MVRFITGSRYTAVLTVFGIAHGIRFSWVADDCKRPGQGAGEFQQGSFSTTGDTEITEETNAIHHKGHQGSRRTTKDERRIRESLVFLRAPSCPLWSGSSAFPRAFCGRLLGFPPCP